MASPLAATLVSRGKYANIAHSGETVDVVFSEPPPTATEVTIKVLEPHGALVIEFVGSITGKQFTTTLPAVQGKLAPPRADGTLYFPPEHQRINISAGGVTAPAVITDGGFVDPVAFGKGDDGKPKRKAAPIPSPFTIINELIVSVSGIVGGRKEEFFQGDALLQVVYRQVMIVPTGTTRTDPSIGPLFIQAWAAQWQKADRMERSLHKIPVITPVIPDGPISTTDYDPLIQAAEKAAAAGPDAILAVAVGHSWPGDTDSNRQGWAYLMPEDAKKDALNYFPNLALHVDELNDGRPVSRPDGIKTEPSEYTKVKLDALDRMADVFEKHPIRKLILHGCMLGGDAEFMQAFADRVRVPVQAHTAEVEYDAADPPDPARSIYRGDAPPNPFPFTDWPVGALSGEFMPSLPFPKRFPPRKGPVKPGTL